MPFIYKMLRFSIFAMFLSFVAGFPVSSGVGFGQTSSTPTVQLNDSKIIQQTTKRAGINLGSINYYDTGQLLKNLVGSLNPGFEPTISQQIWGLTAAGTKTTFTDPDEYDPVPANYWTGGTFTVIASQSNGAELGCTGTIASNTGPNYPNENNINPQFTMATSCAAPFNIGDIVIFSKTTTPTPESWWEGGQAGIWGSVSGGGKLLSDTTDLCSTCGTQALQMNATANGSSATVNEFYDSASTQNLFVLMNGTYQISFWAKAASGSPVLSVSASRLSPGGFSCGSFTPALSSTWTQYTYSCKASETQASTTPGTATLNFSVSGGAVDLDNLDFEKTGGSSTNTTVFRDEVINALQTYYNTSSGGNGGMLRNWLDQNAETIDNWTQPDYNRKPSVSGTLYFDGLGASGSLQLSLEDYLEICQLLHAEPYLEVPVTFSTKDAASLVEFLGGSSSTTYGARRAALGQVNPWTSVFSQIHLSYCNECWNGGTFPGQSLPWRSNEPANEFLYDYSVRARDIFAAMRTSSSYSSTAFDLVMNAQTAVNWEMDGEIARAHPDSIEIAAYTYGNVNDSSSDAALWGPNMVEPYDKVIDPDDPSNFYTSVNDYQGQKACGASGVAACNVNIYEWGQGTVNGSVDQTHMDYINAGAGEGVVATLEPLLNLQYYGILNHAYFALAGFDNSGQDGRTVKLWGNTVDMGGATNNVRPQFLALSLMNKSLIGPMYACPISNNITYNFAGSSANGAVVPPGVPKLNNVPYLYAFCFQSGNNRSLILINTDLTNSRTLAFSGTNVPSGTVTQRQFAPAGLDDMNESPTGTVTNTTKAKVVLTTTTLSSPNSLTLPPHSVTALDYVAAGSSPSTQVAAPSISPAGGSYSQPVTATIADSTSGATIYYTTNGEMPTSSSQKYTGPITISSSETLEAIAILSGYANSNVTAATYTISSSSSGLPNYPSGFTSTMLESNGTAAVSDGALQLTNGQLNESGSVWYTTKIPISAFTSDFTFQILNAVADGFTFTIQNAASGPTTLGANRDGLGYAGIGNSIALKFDLYNNAGEGQDSTGTYLDGAIPTMPAMDLSSNNINLHSSDVLHAHVVYDGNTLTLTLTDTKTGAVATRQFSANIPAIVGGSTAYVGFTGSTGSAVSTQKILTWTFSNTVTPQIVSAPTFSPAGGNYVDTQQVTVSDSTKGAQIYYTTDGSTPTTSSTAYKNPISVSSNETIRAVAVVPGETNSDLAAAAYSIGNANGLPDYPHGMTSNMLVMNGSSIVENGGLWLTLGNPMQAGSAWYSAKVPIGTFSSDFTFQLLSAVADGFTFTIQSDKRGTGAMGGAGDMLGYAGINNSVGLKFDLYNNAGEGSDSTGLYLDGATPTIPANNLSASGINLHSGDVFQAHVTYDGTTLAITLTDTRTGAVATLPFIVDIPKAVGGTSAYVGFTGSTGGSVATQEILSWTFSNAITSSAAAATTFKFVGGPRTKAQPGATNGTANEAIATVIAHTDNDSVTAIRTIGPSTASADSPSLIRINSTMLSTNGAASVDSNTIQLANDKSAQAGSAWYTNKVSVNRFSTDFDFKMTDVSGNGLTFTLQNDSKGIWALGNEDDSKLNSNVSVKFALDKTASKGASVADICINGIEPASLIFNLGTSGIKLESGDVFHARLTYDGSTLLLTLTDTKTGTVASQKFLVDIPAAVGGNAAYAGFTGEQKAVDAAHRVSNWTFTSQ